MGNGQRVRLAVVGGMAGLVIGALSFVIAGLCVLRVAEPGTRTAVAHA